MLHVTIEGKKSVDQIRKDFESKLSPAEINKTIAFSINETSRKSIVQSRKFVTSKYTISRKYVTDKMYKMKPSSAAKLYSEISISSKPPKMSYFKYTDTKKSKKRKLKNTGVVVEIIKGKKQILRHAFVAQMKSGHIGVFGMGRYVDGKFVNEKIKVEDRLQQYRNGKRIKKTEMRPVIKGRYKITELHTVSVLGAWASPDHKAKIVSSIKQDLPNRTRALLQKKLDKLDQL